MSRIINGIGLYSALGGYEATCAAYVANKRGLKRDRTVIGADGIGVTMAAAIPMDEIRDIVERLATLVARAFEDLAQQVEISGKPGLSLCLPPWLRDTPLTDALAEELSNGPLRRLGEIRLLWGDDAPFAQILAEAAQTSDETALIGVVDTFLDPDLLDALALSDRILRTGQPHGLIPGEAAVIMRVTPQDAEIAPRGVGHMAGARVIEDPANVMEPEELLGDPLADLWEDAVRARVDRLIVDLNGERWRAEEIAHVLARHGNALPPGISADFETPALNFGHAGVAMGGIMVALALADGPKAPDAAEEWTLISNSQMTGKRIVARIGRAVPELTQEEST